jgi:hypothetical protein
LVSIKDVKILGTYEKRRKYFYQRNMINGQKGENYLTISEIVQLFW